MVYKSKCYFVQGNLALLQVWYWEKVSVSHIYPAICESGSEPPLMQYWDQKRVDRRLNIARQIDITEGRIVEDIQWTLPPRKPCTAAAENISKVECDNPYIKEIQEVLKSCMLELGQTFMNGFIRLHNHLDSLEGKNRQRHRIKVHLNNLSKSQASKDTDSAQDEERAHETNKDEDKSAKLEKKNAPNIPTTQYIWDAPKDKKLVDYGDGYIATRGHLDCLLDDTAYVNGETANAYIRLLACAKGLKHREDGEAYLENSYITGILQRDGKDKYFPHGEDKIFPIDTNHRQFLVRRARTYLKHEMVFYPINIVDHHWYVAVLNAHKREIQILDSAGSKSKHEELDLTLEGLEKHLKIVADLNLMITNNWKDMNVTQWTHRDYAVPIQYDGVSCALFMLNNIQFWNGTKVSTRFTQTDMTNFRLKLAIILVNSSLNLEKGSPGFKETEANMEIPEGDEEIEVPDAEEQVVEVPKELIQIPDDN